jgi:hypothetical protein
MSTDQPLDINDTVNNESSLEKPVSLFLSDFEKEQGEQNFDELISILLNIISPKSIEKKVLPIQSLV